MFDLIMMREAELTYAHHCCAFSHPELQYPEIYKEFMHMIQESCGNSTEPTTTPISYVVPSRDDTLAKTGSIVRHRRRRANDDMWRMADFVEPVLPGSNTSSGGTYYQNDDYIWYADEGLVPEGDGGTGMWDWGDMDPVLPVDTGMDGVWITETLDPNKSHVQPVQCGIVSQIKNVKCQPLPDDFNPCEDVMGYLWLRVLVWIVVLTALLGNLLVLTVTISSRSMSKFTVSKFLMCNLAFSDLMISLYLLLLAAFDMHTMGVYFTKAIAWHGSMGAGARWPDS